MKIKSTFNASVAQVTFGPSESPTLTVEHLTEHNDAAGEKYKNSNYIQLPVDPKRLAKLIGVTDVEITITVTPKGAKKPKKAKKVKASEQTVPTTATNEPSNS